MRWSKSDIEILKMAYKDMTFSDMQEVYFCNRSIASIKTKSKLLKLNYKRKKLTDKERQYIIQNFANMQTAEIAKQLGYSHYTVSNFAYRIGLKKSPEIIRQNGINVANSEASKNTRFKKGHISANKGKKITEYMTAEQILKVHKTTFKKGMTPHNTKPIGSISEVKAGDYLEIKLSEKEWEPLHRHIWKQHNGDIPAGCNIQFKDGNRRNCAIENLYLVSRSDQAVMNARGIPLELVTTVKHISKINKILKKNGNK